MPCTMCTLVNNKITKVVCVSDASDLKSTQVDAHMAE
jgi:hypothetical protein